MTSPVGALANATISVTYFAICYAILAPLVRARQVRANRLGTSTAAIFFSCAVGHGLHALDAAAIIGSAHAGTAAHDAMVGLAGHSALGWYGAAWDLLTAAVGVNYWTLRRTYGALMKGGTLFEDLQQQARIAELEHRDALATAGAAAEREREAQAAIMSALIANSQSLIYVKDLEGRYLLANAPFQRAFSVTEDALLGKTDDLLDPVLAPVWRANDLRAQVEEFAVEEWSDAPDGRHYYESVKFPLRDPDGRVYATCGVSLDVTQRRQATLEMARARDAALAATAAKSAFLATMSHEIRTPMNAVIGMTGLLLETPLDEHQREFVETIRDSGETLLTVINDILDFSKIEAGELELEEHPFEVQDCVESALALVALAADEKGLELVADLDASCPELVSGDVTRLRQVLVNLLGNAVKFTEAGEVLVSVTAERLTGQVDGPVRLTVAVRDTGIGIPDDRLDRLFEPFSQVDSSTTRTHGGTGLGLSISRRLVEAMGGKLHVVSQLGVGSTFTFTAVLRGCTDRRRPVAAPPAVSLAGTCALVVDDNATNRRVLQLLMQRWGMACTDVATPAAALQLLAAGRTFDVAVLDMHMPGMDGAQLAAALRQLPAGRDLPLILLTSLQWQLDPELRARFVASLTKPARSSVLREKLQAALAPAEAAMHAVETAGGRRRGDGPALAPAMTPAPLHVLLAEDNPVNQKVAQLMLDKLGHRVHTVGNGREALEAVRRADYDVVLMDVRMPQLDGLRATELIRAELPADRQPVIVGITANAQPEDRAACADAGMDAYLTKPVRRQELRAVLARLCPLAACPSAADQRPGPDRGTGGPASGGPASGDAGEPDALAAREAAIRARLAELTDGDPDEDRELLGRLLRSFASRAPRLLDELQDAARRGAAGEVEQQAHSLNGSAGNVGAHHFAVLCQQLEVCAREQDLAPAPELLRRLHEELRLVGHAVRQVCAELERSLAARSRG